MMVKCHDCGQRFERDELYRIHPYSQKDRTMACLDCIKKRGEELTQALKQARCVKCGRVFDDTAPDDRICDDCRE